MKEWDDRALFAHNENTQNAATIFNIKRVVHVLLLWIETSKLAQKLAKLYIFQWLKGLFNISSHISIIVIFASWKKFELLKNYAKNGFLDFFQLLHGQNEGP